MMEWYAYKHENGELFLRRFWDYEDIVEASSSPFVVSTIGPFYADNRETALEIMNRSFC